MKGATGAPVNATPLRMVLEYCDRVPAVWMLVEESLTWMRTSSKYHGDALLMEKIAVAARDLGISDALWDILRECHGIVCGSTVLWHAHHEHREGNKWVAHDLNIALPADTMDSLVESIAGLGFAIMRPKVYDPVQNVYLLQMKLTDNQTNTWLPVHVAGYVSRSTLTLKQTLSALAQNQKHKRQCLELETNGGMDGLRSCDTREVFRVMCEACDFDFLKCATDGATVFHQNREALTMFYSAPLLDKPFPKEILTVTDAERWSRTLKYYLRGARLPEFVCMPTHVSVHVDASFTFADRFAWKAPPPRAPRAVVTDRLQTSFGYVWVAPSDSTYSVIDSKDPYITFWAGSDFSSRELLLQIIRSGLALYIYQQDEIVGHLCTTPPTNDPSIKRCVVLQNQFQ